MRLRDLREGERFMFRDFGGIWTYRGSGMYSAPHSSHGPFHGRDEADVIAVDRDNPPNARFWTWINGGWVKLTLKPGERNRWWFGQTDSEGWFREHYSWEYKPHALADVRVVCTIDTESLDCDGRYDHHTEMECNIERIRGRKVECAESGETYYCPDWIKVGSSQRDYAAEKAGY